MRKPILLSLLLLFSVDVFAQLVAIDTTRPILADEVVVTATRSARTLEQVPVPVTVIGIEEIRSQGMTRLDDLLDNQLGVNLEYNRTGSVGVQLQGLDAAYTLILIDGEPVSGNIEGFVDISRIPVTNVERIEVTHGPSSSLYGSEALAGVINIITKRAEEPLAASATAQYGSHNTLQLGTRLESRGPRHRASVYVDRYGSDGYDLRSSVPGETVPPIETYDMGASATLENGTRFTGTLSGHASFQDVTGVSALQQGIPDRSSSPQLDRTDWRLRGIGTYTLDSLGRLQIETSASRSSADARFSDTQTQELRTFFTYDQFRNESELLGNLVIGSDFLLTAGSGMIYEAATADYMAGAARKTVSGFAYTQLEWVPGSDWDLIGGVRYDRHPDYAAQISPKVAAMYHLGDITFRASVGRGFRAPSHEQRYINFTNPLGGNYTVFGSEGLNQSLTAFEEAGLIQDFLIDPSQIDEIRPESSWAYSLGATHSPRPGLRVRINGFYNDVTDLIETRVLAVKTDGQNLFSYLNVGSVRTRGFDVEVDSRLVSYLSSSIGYQFLDAETKESGNQLAGRSRHSATVQFLLNHSALDLSANLRGQWRSEYPFVTGTSLSVASHSLWGITVTKGLGDLLTVGAGLNNIFDYTNPRFQPEESGRTWFLRLSITP